VTLSDALAAAAIPKLIEYSPPALASTVCDDDDSVCINGEKDSASGSAMLQAYTRSSKRGQTSICSKQQPSLMETHLMESRACLPKGLQEKHLQSMRRHAAMLASGSDGREVSEQPGVTGASASLDAAGFKAATSLCCPPEMEVFFERLLNSMSLSVCSKPHLQGLMHWFSCVPDMDFAYVQDVINNGNPCKYWAPTGTTCPALTPECDVPWCR